MFKLFVASACSLMHYLEIDTLLSPRRPHKITNTNAFKCHAITLNGKPGDWDKMLSCHHAIRTPSELML